MSKTSTNVPSSSISCTPCHPVVSPSSLSKRNVLPTPCPTFSSTPTSPPLPSTEIALNVNENVLSKCSVAVRHQSWSPQPSPLVVSISPTSPMSSITISPAISTITSIESVVQVALATLVSPPHSSTVETATSHEISSSFSRKPTKKYPL